MLFRNVMIEKLGRLDGHRNAKSSWNSIGCGVFLAEPFSRYSSFYPRLGDFISVYVRNPSFKANHEL